MNKKSIKFTLITLISFLLLMGCDNNSDSRQLENNFKALKLFPQAKSFSGFSLTNQAGEDWPAEAFAGEYSVVFFGFTHCPDICPTTLLDMQKIDKQLKAADIKSPRFVFISVDPDRDTPAVLQEYINFFNPEFHALTGDAANILSLASQLGVAYKVAEHQVGDLIYDVDHASSLFILNQQGQRIGIFTAPHDVELISHDLMQLMEST
ncbi:MAG: SCO family protein [Marinicella sp.]